MPGPMPKRPPEGGQIQARPMSPMEAKAASAPIDELAITVINVNGAIRRRAQGEDLDLKELPGAMAALIEATGFIVSQRRIIHALTQGLIDTPGR